MRTGGLRFSHHFGAMQAPCTQTFPALQSEFPEHPMLDGAEVREGDEPRPGENAVKNGSRPLRMASSNAEAHGGSGPLISIAPLYRPSASAPPTMNRLPAMISERSQVA